MELPGVAVNVEDAVAKKVGESSIENVAFSVVREVGLENVLDHGRVAREDLAGGVVASENKGGGR